METYDVGDATGTGALHQVELCIGVAVLRLGGGRDEEGVGELVAEDGRVQAGLDVGDIDHGTGPEAVAVEHLEEAKRSAGCSRVPWAGQGCTYLKVVAVRPLAGSAISVVGVLKTQISYMHNPQTLFVTEQD